METTTEIKLTYKTILAQYEAQVSDLSKHAKGGIDDINQLLKAVNMVTKSGKTVSEATLEKIERLDKWVSNEIIDQFEETDDNDDTPGVTKGEILKDIKDDAKEGDSTEDDDADKVVDVELDALFKSGKTELNFDELMAGSPRAFQLTFPNWRRGQENGLRTTHFDLSEKEQDSEIFILKKL